MEEVKKARKKLTATEKLEELQKKMKIVKARIAKEKNLENAQQRKWRNHALIVFATDLTNKDDFKNLASREEAIEKAHALATQLKRG